MADNETGRIAPRFDSIRLCLGVSRLFHYECDKLGLIPKRSTGRCLQTLIAMT